MTAGLRLGPLGAPGVYPAPERLDRSLRPVRLDVAAFVGVAPRGPVDQPVLVQSWTDYAGRFGGFERPGSEGPGFLPYAVSAFFEQGGRRAWVVRVAPPYDGEGRDPAAEAATARHQLPEAVTTAGAAVTFAAHDEGSWGDGLHLRLVFETGRQFRPAARGPTTGPGELALPAGVEFPAHSLLRLRGPGLPPPGELRWVDRIEAREGQLGRRLRVAVLDRPLPPVPAGQAGARVATVVTATLEVDDQAVVAAAGTGGQGPGAAGHERIGGLGLHPGHPRYLATAVAEESVLVAPVGPWTDQPVPPPDPLLAPLDSKLLSGGCDRFAEITGASFFDAADDDGPAGADDDTDDDAHRGVDRVVRVAEVAILVVPDLLWSWVAEQPTPERFQDEPGPTFAPCPGPAVLTTYQPPAPRAVPLDARDPGLLNEIVARQRRLVAVADRHRRFVVLLDVPSGLQTGAIASWRAGFDSSFAAAYHPWLAVTRTAGTRQERRDVPPSAFAAGIVAARERRFGLPWGPANELALGAIVAAATVTAAEHDTLHQLGVNVFRAERDGFRLSAARTLAGDRAYRQLSVRRLMTMLMLALDRQSQWVVFEPNTPALRALLHRTIEEFLRALYRNGAFTGTSEEEAFFVRSGDDLNPRASLELGRLVVEVGVAPAEPLEFLILRIAREGDGGVRVEEDSRA
jgi:hypothetical protein